MWRLLRSLGEQAIPRVRLLLSLSRRLRSRSCSRAACCLRPIFTSHQRSLHSTQCRHRGAFCARPSPRGRLFVDCRVRRVQLGGHGGPDHDRRDHHHRRVDGNVTLVATAISQLRLFKRARTAIVACAALVAGALTALATSIYRRCRHRRSSRSTLLSSSLLAINVIVVVAPREQR